MKSWVTTVLLAALMGLSALSRAQVVYQENVRGTVLLTGNTLGLSGGFNENGPGLEDSIHTFISLDALLTDDQPVNPGNPWPAGTTSDYLQNGSTAELDLPDGAVVLYAELVWSGSYRYGIEDVSASLNDAITFVTPQSSTSVLPNPATAATIDIVDISGFGVRYYLRSADVTAMVGAAGTGTYAVEGVPGTQDTIINSANAAGWSLAVAIAAPDMSCKTLHVALVGQWVSEDTLTVHTIAPLEVPNGGQVSGQLLLSALEGDADRTGDSVSVSVDKDTVPFALLSGSNNPADNFFASQINDSFGVLDQRGLMGDVNHNAIAGTNNSGGRQGWDTTGISIGTGTGELTNSMDELSVRFATTGDSYLPAMLGFAVDTSAACLVVIEEIFTDGFENP